MYRDESVLLDFDVPIMFTDGTAFWEQLARQYTRHDRGFYILGPSGVGKSHFIKQQARPDWIDGDIVWDGAHAAPKGEWWLRAGEELDVIDARSDVITQQARMLGFRLVGASMFWLRPDAVVLPDWEVHKQYIQHREQHDYDGGAKSDALEQVMRHRRWISEHAAGVPVFASVAEAAVHLESLELLHD